MSNRIYIFACVVLAAPALNAQESADEQRVPRAVSITPAVGAENVDPNLKAIRVQFDMPMSHDGYSFVGSGPNFPQPTATARWIDAGTCELPVKLKANWEYRFSINSPRFQNFRSVWLVPAMPRSCHFKTGGITSIKRSPEEQRALNIESFDALCNAIRSRYAYLELRPLDWEELFAEHRRDVVLASTIEEWTSRSAKMLAAANDVHLTFKMDERVFSTAVREVRPNYAWEGVAAIIPGVERLGPDVAAGMTDDGIGYILIAGWSAQVGEQLDRVEATLGRLSDAPGIVIDVRPNTGGSESLARRIAAWFVDRSQVYAKHAYRRGPGPDDFTPVRERTIEPHQPPRRYTGPVAVLMGPACMSSCEAFLLMMKQAPRATLVGQRSFGSSGNPRPTFLPNGVLVFIPSWKAMRPNGTTFEGQGIEPDVRVLSEGVDFARHDPVLHAALGFLRQSKTR